MRFNIYLYLELRTRWKSSFPDVLKSTSGRSPLPPPLPLPIFPGKRRKTNWAVEPLEFSICPKLTPELSRPPRFRLFPRISRFSFSFPNEEPKSNIHAFPSKRGKEGEEELTSLDSNSPRRKGVNLQFYRWNKFARVWGPPPLPLVFERRLVLTRAKQNCYARIPLCPMCSLYSRERRLRCNVVTKY